MSRDLERDVQTLARFAAEVYMLADASVPEHLTWQVRLYDDPLHATPSPVVELRVSRGAQGRKMVWMPELVVQEEHNFGWPALIRRGIDSLRDDLRV